MEVREAKIQPPRGLSRLLYRLPIWLYRMGIGWLLGKRFLLLNHIGRVSRKLRQTVLEVTDYDETQQTYQVASGFGKKSDWYRNVRKYPEVQIQVGRQRFEAEAELLSPDESGQAMVDYAKRHPTAARNLSRMIGFNVDGSESGYRQIGLEHIPFVRFHCR